MTKTKQKRIETLKKQLINAKERGMEASYMYGSESRACKREVLKIKEYTLLIQILQGATSYMFKDDKHQQFFEEQIAKTNSANDPYTKALFYTLGLTEETIRNICSLYDFEKNQVKPEGLKGEWQNGTTRRVCRLALNLYNGEFGGAIENEGIIGYTPYGLFDCGLMTYMLEAVKIRHEKYAWLPY